MAATVTWSASNGESNLQSTFAATNQGAIQLMNEYFTALAAFGDFPWQVCSFEGTTAPWFVTLKRKDGSPGRIIFVAVSSAPGTTYNPQFGTYAWPAASIRAAYFRDATSDTPSNILATSGDVFTNPTNRSGMGATLSMTVGATKLAAWGCAAGIYLVAASGGGAVTAAVAVGDFLEDDVGTEYPASCLWLNGTMDNVPPSAAPAASTSGIHTILSEVAHHFGAGYTAPTALSSFQRDASGKRSWFYPRGLGSYTVQLGSAMKYKLRQIAYGPTPLGSYEQEFNLGGTLNAISTHPGTQPGYAWLVNFKV